MSNLKKRILSFLLVTAMLATCITVFAVDQGGSVATATYSFDLSIDDSKSENHFRYDAISKKDGRLVGVEDTARGTWQDEYLGFWPVNANGGVNYVFYDTEDGSYGSIIDMVSSGDYKSAVVFTAPEDGVYDIYFKGVKYQSTANAYIDVALMRVGSSRPLATAIKVNGANYAGEVVFDVDGVQLSAGDEIMVVSTINEAHAVSGSDNLGILKFDVAKVGTEGGTEYGNSTYVFSCDETAKTCGNFYLAGRSTADGTINRLRNTPSVAWSGDSYDMMGWKPIPSGSPAVFCETQVSNPKTGESAHGLGGEFAYIDMMPRASYDSVVVFTAPVSGTYSFDSLFSKLGITSGRPAIYKITVLQGETELASYTFAEQSPSVRHEDAALKGEDISLKTGETIMFVASNITSDTTGNNDPEIAIRSIEVTLDEATPCEHDWNNGVCKNCYSYCVHEWNNGVCVTCGAACDHYWNNGACDHCAVLCYHDWSYDNGESSCSICGRVTDEIYIKHVSDLYTNKTVDGRFFIGALRNADGVVCAVEPEPSFTFADGYDGNWVVGSDHSVKPTAYVTQKTESGNPAVRFDMYPSSENVYSGLVGFNVPEDGIFTVYAKLEKVFSGKPEIVVMDNNGNEYYSITITEYAQKVDIKVGNIELNKGDQLLLVVKIGNGGNMNTGFISFDVGGLYKTCPHEWNAATASCSVCGVGCPGHDWSGEDGVCAICGFACAHDWTNNDGVCKTCEIKCNHDWSKNDGVCVTCGFTHSDHDWNAETGACKTCGLVHAHDVTADDATCVSGAVCSCGYTYAKNPTNHVSNEFTYTVIDGVTHKVAYKCCGAEAPDGDCVYGND
ncbi:MAG: hypothetical protein IJY94_04935, partial [Clostridia bacterium]|nr:hypothetical protein [Clostridia bacterium]